MTESMPDKLLVQMRPLADLLPYARNARTHSDEQVAQIAAAMIEWGWTNPILFDSKGIVAGHGRRLAALKLMGAGMPLKFPDGRIIPSGMAPCIDVSGWSDAQRRAYIIADNRLAENAEWDNPMLALDLGELKLEGFDLALTGFDGKDLALFLSSGKQGNTDRDDVPEPPTTPVSRPGDVWLLGAHRIMCGDSTSKGDVETLLHGDKPHLMVTDPPYGVEYDPSWRGKTKRTGKVLNDDRDDWRAAWALFPGDVAYVWHGERQCVSMGSQLYDAGFEVRNLIVWAKPSLTFGRGHYHSQHETCWYAVARGETASWNGDSKQTTLWEIERPGKEDATAHGTQKPVECMRRPIENNSQPDDLVYEPFSGSGTTIIAAELMNRRCLAMELFPAYVDVAVKRWEAFTGQSATLSSHEDAESPTFAEVSASRAGAQATA